MTAIPERINRRWITQLDDAGLSDAEAELHAEFTRCDRAEKTRVGAKYRLLEGPASLVEAWLRWRMVNNEVVSRGLTAHQRKPALP